MYTYKIQRASEEIQKQNRERGRDEKESETTESHMRQLIVSLVANLFLHLRTDRQT